MITGRIAKFLFSGQRIERPWEEKLSWSQKISRLGSRMRDPEWRRYGRLLTPAYPEFVIAPEALPVAILAEQTKFVPEPASIDVNQAKTASASAIP